MSELSFDLEDANDRIIEVPQWYPWGQVQKAALAKGKGPATTFQLVRKSKEGYPKLYPHHVLNEEGFIVSTDGSLKDSGERRSFNTGAVRDAAGGKARWDLMPVFALTRLAQHFRKGAEKYDARNWEKGMPLSVFYTSALNHLQKYLAGFTDEPHLDAALWNIACLAEGEERIKRGLWPAEFDDMPKTYAGQEPWT